ncbi:predicted protein [Sclerotinia sclerotiorum 1980 UF-70]|uniref:Uncharacterized protein n=2 Tax=Sclerotinia sclerotiorum (strain ATCC 18683 / 1980 / Ss-1) TaxID=665079 RepID=A0A1D9QJQ0_SCLS1|nr:predicted protein [Sclerotinia sclerotiorum 1980 UF-70]APA15032.1 hypothetical protein sscle_14g098020 [Sclerotinia sclerotiorum 1980 UF-70]EDN98765.1 predicted protein [Sclerotinia sclerotiorum 1980 UF-70]
MSPVETSSILYSTLNQRDLNLPQATPTSISTFITSTIFPSSTNSNSSIPNPSTPPTSISYPSWSVHFSLLLSLLNLIAICLLPRGQGKLLLLLGWIVIWKCVEWGHWLGFLIDSLLIWLTWGGFWVFKRILMWLWGELVAEFEWREGEGEGESERGRQLDEQRQSDLEKANENKISEKVKV